MNRSSGSPDPKPSKRWKTKIQILLLILFLVSIASMNIGFKPISLPNIFASLAKQIPLVGAWAASFPVPEVDQVIVTEVRLPRILLGILVGSSLSASGAVLQGIFRNPLAEPYVTGISAGAAFGASLTIVAGLGVGIIGASSTMILAFLGSLLAAFATYSLAKVGARIPVTTLLLSGIAVSVLLSALVTIMIVLSGEQLGALIFWLIGSLSTANWAKITAISPIILLGLIAAYIYSRDLNLLQLGEETAQSLGVETEKVKKILLAVAALIASTSVSVAGIIGFVGLIVPHITRMMLGPDHRLLIPAAAINGAIFLVICDAFARSSYLPLHIGGIIVELPVGVVTALAGAPFFLYVLRKQKGSYAL